MKRTSVMAVAAASIAIVGLGGCAATADSVSAPASSSSAATQQDPAAPTNFTIVAQQGTLAAPGQAGVAITGGSISGSSGTLNSEVLPKILPKFQLSNLAVTPRGLTGTVSLTSPMGAKGGGSITLYGTSNDNTYSGLYGGAFNVHFGAYDEPDMVYVVSGLKLTPQS